MSDIRDLLSGIEPPSRGRSLQLKLGPRWTEFLEAARFIADLPPAQRATWPDYAKALSDHFGFPIHPATISDYVRKASGGSDPGGERPGQAPAARKAR